MFTGCSLDVHWMFAGCSLDVHWMFTGCSLDVHWMFTGCSLDVHWMFAGCSLDVHWMFTVCSLYLHCMFTVCSLDVHWMFTGCSLDVPWMFAGCSLDVRWMFTGCSLDVHWMLPQCSLPGEGRRPLVIRGRLSSFSQAVKPLFTNHYVKQIISTSFVKSAEKHESSPKCSFTEFLSLQSEGFSEPIGPTSRCDVDDNSNDLFVRFCVFIVPGVGGWGGGGVGGWGGGGVGAELRPNPVPLLRSCSGSQSSLTLNGRGSRDNTYSQQFVLLNP
jgi:hypothetical protein